MITKEDANAQPQLPNGTAEDQDLLSLFYQGMNGVVSIPTEGNSDQFNATIIENANGYELRVDLDQFEPGTTIVKLRPSENVIVIEAKYKELFGDVELQPKIQNYILPDKYDIYRAVPNIASDGFLSITAPFSNSPD